MGLIIYKFLIFFKYTVFNLYQEVFKSHIDSVTASAAQVTCLTTGKYVVDIFPKDIMPRRSHFQTGTFGLRSQGFNLNHSTILPARGSEFLTS